MSPEQLGSSSIYRSSFLSVTITTWHVQILTKLKFVWKQNFDKTNFRDFATREIYVSSKISTFTVVTACVLRRIKYRLKLCWLACIYLVGGSYIIYNSQTSVHIIVFSKLPLLLDSLNAK